VTESALRFALVEATEEREDAGVAILVAMPLPSVGGLCYCKRDQKR
jgi:hypothetical protein